MALKEAILKEYDLDNKEDAEMYDELLDSEGPVIVAGMKFDPSYILKNLDETAYCCGFNDYTDSLDERWECPECGEIHDDEDKAKYCCQEEEEETEEKK
jgi:hypothetical protein